MKLSDMALDWLGTIIDWVRAKIGKKVVKVRRYIRDLMDLERGEGADTEAWRRIQEAAEAAESVTLNPEEAIYLHEFKGLWDKYFKEPLRKLADLVRDDDEDGEG